MLINSFYEIESSDLEKNDEAIFSIRLFVEHEIYIGHFPDHPITPGAVMLQILKELTELYLDRKLHLKNVSNVKFLSLVDPNKDGILIFHIKVDESNEQYRIKNSTTFPDGRIVLKCNATFVVR